MESESIGTAVTNWAFAVLQPEFQPGFLTSSYSSFPGDSVVLPSRTA